MESLEKRVAKLEFHQSLLMEMVDEAKKYFKTKCFTTEQVRNLGSLFLSSAGKYLFYDAAYFHVTDRG